MFSFLLRYPGLLTALPSTLASCRSRSFRVFSYLPLRAVRVRYMLHCCGSFAFLVKSLSLASLSTLGTLKEVVFRTFIPPSYQWPRRLLVHYFHHFLAFRTFLLPETFKVRKLISPRTAISNPLLLIPRGRSVMTP